MQIIMPIEDEVLTNCLLRLCKWHKVNRNYVNKGRLQHASKYEKFVFRVAEKWFYRRCTDVEDELKENRIKEYTNKFLQKIVKELAGADEILLFGPAQMKFKLEKIITDTPDLALKLKATNTSGNMTHNQKLAYVRDFFKIS